MKRIILMGRTGSGKTTLSQVLQGYPVKGRKTQGVVYNNIVIDTPGEYAEGKYLSRALALYSYEAQIVGLLCGADEPFSLFSPCIAGMVNREVIGIITRVDVPNACPERAEHWLRLAGCKKVFHVNPKSGEGVDKLIEYLKESSKNSDS